MDHIHLIEEAVTLAREEHRDQQDHFGGPLLDHLTRVSGLVQEQGGTPEAVALSWLHHIFRDTDISAVDLQEMGFTPPLIEAITLLTPADHHSEQQWFEAIAADDLARIVKIADVEDNTRQEVLDSVTEEQRVRLEKFRERALSQLAR